jgi:hypothetical protein
MAKRTTKTLKGVVNVEQKVSVKKDAKREIIGLALLLEDVSDLTVFADYSGHVKNVAIRVFENEGEENEIVLLQKSFYADFSFGTIKEYEEIKAFLHSKIEEYTAI